MPLHLIPTTGNDVNHLMDKELVQPSASHFELFPCIIVQVKFWEKIGSEPVEYLCHHVEVGNDIYVVTKYVGSKNGGVALKIES